jgi:hypothetical protein
MSWLEHEARKKWDVALGLRELSVILSLCLVALYTWVLLISPHLLRVIKPLADASPYVHATLYASVGFSMLPFSLIPPWLALYWYQRRCDRSRAN